MAKFRTSKTKTAFIKKKEKKETVEEKFKMLREYTAKLLCKSEGKRGHFPTKAVPQTPSVKEPVRDVL